MARRKYNLQTDKAGNWYLDVPLEGGSTSVRVSFRRWYFAPSVGDDGKVQVELLAKQLEREITGGTLRIENLFEHEGMSFPVDIDLDSRDDLETLVRAVRKVFNEGLKRSNEARKNGLTRCKERLAEHGAVQQRQPEDRVPKVDRRQNGDRRSLERRQWYAPPTKDLRKSERRAGTERRGMREGRVA